MTIASATNKSGPYNGNGVTVAFSGTFKISDQDHVQVILADADGVETVQTITTNYTVSGVGGSGFTVTMLVAPPSGSTVTLIRDVPFTQELDLQNQGAYYAESVEEAFDLAAARDQQLQEQVSRSVKIPASAPVEALDTLIANIVLLGDSADDLAALAAISADVETLAAITAQISTVAGISTAVTTVAAISTQVVAVAAFEAEILDVHAQLANIAILAAVAPSIPGATPMAAQINSASDEAFADTAMLTARKADGTLLKRSWSNVKTAIWTAWGALIGAGTSKATPVDADAIAIMDSADNSATKKLSLVNLWLFIKSKADLLYGSPAIEYVTSITAAASSIIKFDSSTGVTFAANYDYIVSLTSVKPSVDASIYMRYGTGGTPTYQATSYNNQTFLSASTTNTGARDGITTAIQLTPAATGGASANEDFSLEVKVDEPAANAHHTARCVYGVPDVSGTLFSGHTSGKRTAAEVLTGLQILPSAGNFTSGTFTLYRRKIR